MSEVIVKKAQRLSGEVDAPPSKSYTQRMVIAALLSQGISKVWHPLYSEDTEATLRAVTALGAEFQPGGECGIIEGVPPPHPATDPIERGESGATLRFMIPVVALAD